MNAYESFLQVVQRYKGRPALIYLGEVFTYGRLLQAVESLAGGFKSLGIKEQDRIIIYLPNTPQWIISWLAIQKIGAVAIPIAPIYTSRDLRYVAGDSGARTVICADTNFGYAKEIKSEGGLDNIIVTGMADLLPRYKRLIGMAFDRIPEGKIEKGRGVVRLTDLMKKRVSAEAAHPDEHAMLEMLYTGGTTKNPKGVPLNHALFLDSIRAQLEIAYPIVPPPDNVVLQGGPLFHILGQVFGLGPLIITGDCVILMPKVNVDALLFSVQLYKAKTFFGVPALYRMILEARQGRLLQSLFPRLLHERRRCPSPGDLAPMEGEIPP